VSTTSIYTFQKTWSSWFTSLVSKDLRSKNEPKSPQKPGSFDQEWPISLISKDLYLVHWSIKGLMTTNYTPGYDNDVYKCSDCGEVANIMETDIGIGFYEFWGAVSFDSQIVTMTDCCSSEDFEPYYEEDEEE